MAGARRCIANHLALLPPRLPSIPAPLPPLQPLTPCTQVDLFARAPAGAHASVTERMDCALAAAAAGLARRSPALLAQADKMYAAVEAAVERVRRRARGALVLSESERVLHSRSPAAGPAPAAIAPLGAPACKGASPIPAHADDPAPSL